MNFCVVKQERNYCRETIGVEYIWNLNMKLLLIGNMILTACQIAMLLFKCSISCLIIVQCAGYSRKWAIISTLGTITDNANIENKEMPICCKEKDSCDRCERK